MRNQIHAGLALVALTFALAAPTIATTFAANAVGASVGGDVAPADGDIVSYKFHTSPLNSGGLTDLADLRGRPLLIEYWGTH